MILDPQKEFLTMMKASDPFHGICDIYYLTQTIRSYLEASRCGCSQMELFASLFDTWLRDHEEKFCTPGTVSKLFHARVPFNQAFLSDLKGPYHDSLVADIQTNLLSRIPAHRSMLEEICVFLDQDIHHPKTFDPAVFQAYKALLTTHFGTPFSHLCSGSGKEDFSDRDAALLADILLFVMEHNYYRRDDENNVPFIALDRTVPPVNSTPAPTEPFYGRSEELRELDRLLEEKKHVFVSGFAGLGKSELARKYVAEMRPDYHRILYVKYSGSLERDLQSLAATLNTAVSCSGTVPLSYDSRLQELVNPLHRTCGMEQLRSLSERDLIVLDDLDVLPFGNSVTDDGSPAPQSRNLYGAEPLLSEFLDLPCRILMTTRCDYSQKSLGYSDQCLSLSGMDTRTLLLIFRDSGFCSPKDTPLLRKIIGCLDNNTFLVRLTERLLASGHASPLQIWEQLQDNLLTVSSGTRLSFRHWNTGCHDTFGNHIRLLLSLFRLSDTAEKILVNLSLMPADGIPQDLFEHWLGLDTHWATDDLCDVGLIQKFRKHKGNFLSAHRLITDVCYADGKLTIENARTLLASLNHICVHSLGLENEECRACSNAICSVCARLSSATSSAEMQALYHRFIEDAIPFQLLLDQPENVCSLLDTLDVLSTASRQNEDHLLYLLNRGLFFPEQSGGRTDDILRTFKVMRDFIFALPQAARDTSLIRFVCSAYQVYLKADRDCRKTALLTYMLQNVRRYPDSKYIRLFCYPICIYFGRKELLKEARNVPLVEAEQPVPLPPESSASENSKK